MGGVKMRRRIMRKIELGPDHNQNTPSGGFEKVDFVEDFE